MNARRFLSLLCVLLGGVLMDALAKPALAHTAIDFARLFHGHSAVMLLIDPVSGAIVDANPAAAQFYGHPALRLRQMNIHDINTLTPAQVEAERALANSQKRAYFLFSHRLSDGSVRLVRVHAHPLEIEGRRLLFSIIQDVSDLRSDDESLWHYHQSLEKAVEAKTRELAEGKRDQALFLWGAVLIQCVVIVGLFLALNRGKTLEKKTKILMDQLETRHAELFRLSEVMAHHFQEPVRRLVSFAGRLQSQSKALVDDEDSRLCLDYIRSQSLRLSELVRDVQRYLALDRMAVTDRTKADAHALFYEVLAVRALESTGATVEVRGVLPPVSLDERLLKELFAIVVDNATRYARPETPLYLEVSAYVDADRAFFRFADNGTGILPEYRTQVFDLFARLVSNRIPGTGMGLALLDKAVRLHGGRAQIEDGINGGCAVVFDLPLESDTT